MKVVREHGREKSSGAEVLEAVNGASQLPSAFARFGGSAAIFALPPFRFALDSGSSDSRNVHHGKACSTRAAIATRLGLALQ